MTTAGAVADTRLGWRRFVRPEAALLFGLLAAYAATTNSRAIYHMSLHQGVVRALVEQGTLSLRAFDPRERLGDDVFVHDGRVYARRQPGSFLLGAAAYSILHAAGLSYGDDYFLTGALVSLLTSGLVTAIAAVLLYRLARDRGVGTRWAAGTALAYGLGSTAFPYAGTLHHDVVATAALVGAYAAIRRPFLSAVLLGIAATSSLLAAPMFVLLAARLLLAPVERATPRDRVAPSDHAATGDHTAAGGHTTTLVRGPALLRRAALLVLGVALGAAPLLISDWASFGAPWRMAVLIGGLYEDTSPRFAPLDALRLLGFYGRQMLWYAPIALAGGVGLVLGALRPAPASSAAHTREDRMLLALCAVQVLFLATLGTDGRCQYGPRYLLPAMPFFCLGLIGFAGRSWSRAAGAALIVLGLASGIINLVGSLYGTMFCDGSRWAFAHYADAIRHRAFFSFPLLGIEGQSPY